MTSTSTFTLTCTSSTGDVGIDSVTVNVLPPIPTVNNVTTRVSNTTYCLSGVHATIEGATSDLLGANITGYEVQIDDDSDPLAGNPEWETGIVTVNLPANSLISAGPSSCNPAALDSTPQTQCQMNWNRTYRSWMRVRNSSNLWSDWTQMNTFCNGSSCSLASSWTTPRHALPGANFQYLPSQPTKDDPVGFFDLTTFAAGSINRNWSWNFGGGIPGTAVGRGPHENTYTSTGIYNATLNASDDAGSCAVSQLLNVKRPLPKWIEVLPR